RSAAINSSSLPGTLEGHVPTPDGTQVGYRLYRPTAPHAVKFRILFFHGNGEVAADYDDIAPLSFTLGAALLVADYRGYGWSTGKPLTTTPLPDAETFFAAMPDILQKAQLADLP